MVVLSSNLKGNFKLKMNSTKSILFFLLNTVFVINIYSQDYFQSDKKIDSLFTLIENIVSTKNISSFDEFKDSNKVFIAKDSLDRIINLIYFFYAHEAAHFKEAKQKLWEEWNENGRKDMSPNEKIEGVIVRIGETYGWNFVEYLKTSYFMKLKVKQIFHSRYNSFAPQINVHCTIQDILKGEEYYCIGDSITIVYLPIWFSESGTCPEFKVGNEYILPLAFWDNYPLNSLRLNLQGLHTFYEVINDTVYTPLLPTFYLKQISQTWNEFRDNFNEKYIIKFN